MNKKPTHIGIGIIFNPEKTHIFITQRPSTVQGAGYWEFAGGKVELGESAEQAVIRELNEEVGIKVKALKPFMSLEHTYETKTLLLDFFIVTQFEGKPFGRENQPSQWIEIERLNEFDFPDGNTPVLKKLHEDFINAEKKPLEKADSSKP